MPSWQKLDPRHVEHHGSHPEGKLIVLVGVEGMTPSALNGCPRPRGKSAADLIAELLREADPSVA